MRTQNIFDWLLPWRARRVIRDLKKSNGALKEWIRSRHPMGDSTQPPPPPPPPAPAPEPEPTPPPPPAPEPVVDIAFTPEPPAPKLKKIVISRSSQTRNPAG